MSGLRGKSPAFGDCQDLRGLVHLVELYLQVDGCTQRANLPGGERADGVEALLIRRPRFEAL